MRACAETKHTSTTNPLRDFFAGDTVEGACREGARQASALGHAQSRAPPLCYSTSWTRGPCGMAFALPFETLRALPLVHQSHSSFISDRPRICRVSCSDRSINSGACAPSASTQEQMMESASIRHGCAEWSFDGSWRGDQSVCRRHCLGHAKVVTAFVGHCWPLDIHHAPPHCPFNVSHVTWRTDLALRHGAVCTGCFRYPGACSPLCV